jgi:hypothetical protein
MENNKFATLRDVKVGELLIGRETSSLFMVMEIVKNQRLPESALTEWEWRNKQAFQRSVTFYSRKQNYSWRHDYIVVRNMKTGELAYHVSDPKRPPSYDYMVAEVPEVWNKQEDLLNMK